MTDDYGKGGRLAEALAKAQGEIRNPAKGSENPHFKSRFANLADGIMAIREALSKYGIAHTQTTRIDGAALILTTTLTHAVSGESIESEWPVGAYEKLTPQQMGSSLTYGRRYTLFPMVGIAGADDDDDGNAASGKGKEDDDDPLIDADQITQVQELLVETKSNQEIFFDTLGVADFTDMTAKHFKRALVLLNEKKRRMATAAT